MANIPVSSSRSEAWRSFKFAAWLGWLLRSGAGRNAVAEDLGKAVDL